MTDLQIKLEIAYILGTNHKEFNEQQLKQNKEVTIESFDNLVDAVAKDFEAWEKGKEASQLQLLHDFLDQLNEGYMSYLISEYGV